VNIPLEFKLYDIHQLAAKLIEIYKDE